MKPLPRVPPPAPGTQPQRARVLTHRGGRRRRPDGRGASLAPSWVPNERGERRLGGTEGLRELPPTPAWKHVLRQGPPPPRALEGAGGGQSRAGRPLSCQPRRVVLHPPTHTHTGGPLAPPPLGSGAGRPAGQFPRMPPGPSRQLRPGLQLVSPAPSLSLFTYKPNPWLTPGSRRGRGRCRAHRFPSSQSRRSLRQAFPGA